MKKQNSPNLFTRKLWRQFRRIQQYVTWRSWSWKGLRGVRYFKVSFCSLNWRYYMSTNSVISCSIASTVTAILINTIIKINKFRFRNTNLHRPALFCGFLVSLAIQVPTCGSPSHAETPEDCKRLRHRIRAEQNNRPSMSWPTTYSTA